MATTPAHDALMTGLKSLHLSEKYSDFAIKCGDDVYPIHKAIVCPRSEYFDAATRFGKEGEDRMIDLSADESDIVKLMIQYFYELDYHIPGAVDAQPLSVRYQPIRPMEEADIEARRGLAALLATLNKDSMSEAVKTVQDHYPDTKLVGQTYILDRRHDRIWDITVRNDTKKGIPSWKPEAYQNSPIVHAKMYAIADRYNIVGLKALAIDKFMVASEDHFTNQGFYDAIDIVYTGTMEDDLGLRDIVASYIRDDIEVWGLHPRAEEVLKSVPDLAFGVLKKHYGPKGCGVKGRS